MATSFLGMTFIVLGVSSNRLIDGVKRSGNSSSSTSPMRRIGGVLISAFGACTAELDGCWIAGESIGHVFARIFLRVRFS